MEKVIAIQDLVKTYGKARGVSGITLSVEKGDFFGFIGPNGAGKSTTIRAMLGLIKKDSGSIKILEMDAEREKVAILKRIGYMPSETLFYPNLKVATVIRMTAEAFGMDCKERAKELCERLQVDTSKRIEELSLGNRKKVSIVCTMQHEPDLYIFDEPTSGLDPLMQKEFFELLHEANKKGTTIFFSSHVLSEIQNNCNKAAIIKEGKLITQDTVSSLSTTSARKVTLRGAKEVPDLTEISHLHQETEKMTFLYGGNTNELIAYLNKIELKDVLIEEPSLEEIVLHFYGEE